MNDNKPTIEELIQICRDRNEIDFLFDICKMCAEADSIGEQYGYCSEYKQDDFNNAEPHDYGYCSYLKELGIDIYHRYLQQIKAI